MLCEFLVLFVANRFSWSGNLRGEDQPRLMTWRCSTSQLLKTPHFTWGQSRMLKDLSNGQP